MTDQHAVHSQGVARSVHINRRNPIMRLFSESQKNQLQNRSDSVIFFADL
jgi:hypothetical protein